MKFVLALLVSSVCSIVNGLERSHHIDCMSFPEARHEAYPDFVDEVSFDPSIHLNLTAPTKITDLNFQDHEFPTEVDYDIAMSTPMRILSTEGVAELRKIIDKHRPDYTQYT